MLDVDFLLNMVVTVAACFVTASFISALLRRRIARPAPEGVPMEFSLWRFAAIVLPIGVVISLVIWLGLRFSFHWPMWLSQGLGTGIGIGVALPLAAQIAQRPKQ